MMSSLKKHSVSLNIAQVSLKKVQVSLFTVILLALNNGNGFVCFSDFVSRSAFGVRSYRHNQC